MKNATIDEYQARRRRVGKTAKDRKNGATERRLSNRDARTSWMAERNATNATFPRAVCNGRKNRFVTTGKNAKKVMK